MFEKICPVCDKPFKCAWSGAKYCSRNCFHKSTIKFPIRQCPICKKQFMVSSPAKFCSRECYTKNLQLHRVKKTCIVCGKNFEVPPVYANQFKYCSLKCRYANIQYVTCERCGKKFRTERHDRHYCSEQCRRPPVIAECLTCGKSFRKTPTSPREFCNRHCYHIFRGENRLEKRFREALEELDISFKQEVPFGRFYCVDFTIDEPKLAIEVDGDYWHDKGNDNKKDAFLESLGWNVVRFKQSELYNAPDFKEYVAAKLAVDLLRKEVV